MRAPGSRSNAAGSAYVTGDVADQVLPTTAGAYQTSSAGGRDAFLAKINPAGAGASDLVYLTYLGGKGDDDGFGIAVDSAGSAYVTGDTTATDFPTTSGAYQTSNKGLDDAFVTKLNPAGSALIYSSYFGRSAAAAPPVANGGVAVGGRLFCQTRNAGPMTSLP